MSVKMKETPWTRVAVCLEIVIALVLSFMGEYDKAQLALLWAILMVVMIRD